MPSKRYQEIVEQLFSKADVIINGDRPWDIRVHNERFYKRTLTQGTLGFGESYVDGWWDSDALDVTVSKLMEAKLDLEARKNFSMALFILSKNIINPQRLSNAFQVGKHHYDLGDDVYEAMLDQSMTYTCGYWKHAQNLDEAQTHKLDLTCKKIQLEPGMKVLDIGCGWGSFAKHAAEHYGVEVVGVTISQHQVDKAQHVCEGLPVKILLQDYREIDGNFDRIVSLGMFEHVGCKNYLIFMKKCHQLLQDQGIFLLHTIGGWCPRTTIDPWIDKYIFPNAMLPATSQITKASEKLFIMEDWHNFSAYYDKTLMAWHKNFITNWDKLKQHYDNRFYRTWCYYLLSCAASFRVRKNQVWQIVFSKGGIPGGYNSIR